MKTISWLNLFTGIFCISTVLLDCFVFKHINGLTVFDSFFGATNLTFAFCDYYYGRNNK